MTQNRYFTNFPIINYQGKDAIDITDRVKLSTVTLNNPFVFYPYDVTSSERPDQFSYRYYGDSYKSWLLYLSNGVLDPYYEWYMADSDFYNFINKKYGSVQLAQTKIAYYENNWYQTGSFSITDYNNLPYTLLKYWEPVRDQYNNIISYSRVKANTTITTNKIKCYNGTSNTSFIKDEICTIYFNSNTSGQGQVLAVTPNTVFLQHLSGTTFSSNTANAYIFGQQSKSNTKFTSSTYTARNLLPEEEIYWNPVSYLDYEIGKNESHKSIKVLDSAAAPKVVQLFSDLLKN